MTKLSPDARRLVYALRDERLSADERARLRARVLGGGAALVSTTLAATSASAASATPASAAAVVAVHGKVAAASAAGLGSAVPAAVGTKVLATGLVLKLGAPLVLALAAVPLVRLSSQPSRAPAAVVDSQIAEPAHRAARQQGKFECSEAVAALEIQDLPTADDTAATVPTLAENAPPTAAPLHAAVRADTGRTLRPRGAARAVRSMPEPPTQLSTLAAESLLIERALSALRDGDLTLAEHTLTHHAVSYPNGALAPERERTLLRLQRERARAAQNLLELERNTP